MEFKNAWCSKCKWFGLEAETLLTFNKVDEFENRCPRCEAVIKYDCKRVSGNKFLNGLYTVAIALLFIILYLGIQGFIAISYILTAGKSESPKIFHRDIMNGLKNVE